MTIRRKKLIICFASVLLAVAVFVMFAGTVLAADPAVQSTQGSGTVGWGVGTVGGWIAGAAAIPGLLMWQTLLLIIETLASAVLFITAFFLDNIFYYNVVLNPSNMPIVQEGWAIMRDIANSIFILIILWIAFTLIFNLSGPKTGKLLVRIILIAILINFSLTFVSVVFGVANALALPFQNAISGGGKNNDVAGIIIGRVQLQSIFATPSQATLEKYKNAPEIKDVGCGFGALGDGSVGTAIRSGGKVSGCVLGTEVVDFASSFAKGFTQTADFGGNLSRSVSMSMSILFLLLAILAFIIASITLLIRLVAMVFLGVLAPAAFIAAAIPTAKANALWNKWLSELFCWAFYAPAFYFLFWLSLRMLEVMTDKMPASPGNFGSFVLAMLPFVVFFAFLWASVKIGKYLGCEGAGMAIDWGKKLGVAGLGLATGGAALGAAALARRYAEPAIGRLGETWAGKAVKAVGRVPYLGATLRTATAPIERRVTGYIESQKQKVAGQRKGIENWSDAHLQQEYGRSFLAERKVAIAHMLAERGKFNKLSVGDQESALNLAGQFDPKIALSMLKARPDLVTLGRASAAGIAMPDIQKKKDETGLSLQEAARLIVVEKIKPNEAAKISDENLTPEVIKTMWRALSPSHISQMRRENPALVDKLIGGLTKDIPIPVATYRFFTSSTARSLGLSLPADYPKPAEIVAEETENIRKDLERLGQRIDELKDKAELLAVSTTPRDQEQARRIRVVEIPVLERKIERLRSGAEVVTTNAQEEEAEEE